MTNLCFLGVEFNSEKQPKNHPKPSLVNYTGDQIMELNFGLKMTTDHNVMKLISSVLVHIYLTITSHYTVVLFHLIIFLI